MHLFHTLTHIKTELDKVEDMVNMEKECVKLEEIEQEMNPWVQDVGTYCSLYIKYY